MRALRLLLSLAVFVPAFSALGGFASLDGGASTYFGFAAGGLVGVFFGLVFGGDPNWRVWDHLLEPKEVLTPDKLLEIARLRAEGFSLPEISRQLGISSQGVREGLKRAAGEASRSLAKERR
jgi:hypothetical protein